LTRTSSLRCEGGPDDREPSDAVAGRQLSWLDPSILIVLPIEPQLGGDGIEEKGVDNPDPALRGTLNADGWRRGNEAYRIIEKPGLFLDLRQRLLEGQDTRLEEPRHAVPLTARRPHGLAPLEEADLLAVAEKTRDDSPLKELHTALLSK
jgi:hypothetical protein